LIYWANFDNAFGTSVGIANLDGSAYAPPSIPGADGPCEVAVDGSYVYWANYAPLGARAIGRANLNGSGATPSFVPTGGPPACGVAVDGAHIYWANTGFLASGTSIGRSDLDGNGIVPDFIDGASGALWGCRAEEQSGGSDPYDPISRCDVSSRK
jgi:hypothetical protein